MTFGSLFAGIGGFDLGFERAGLKCQWQVEIDDFCVEVLTKHWPDVPKYRDVRYVGKHNLEPVDVICGGFPCQDISLAGKMAGIKEGTRSGLWSEFHRIICELRPRYAVVENVRNLLSGPAEQPGAWFGRVLADLAEIGYDAEWEVLPASAFGAPHQRERVFVVAYPHSEWELQQKGFKSDFGGWNCNGTQEALELSNSNAQREQRVWTQPIRWFPEFSWVESVRRAEDLRGRSDIPEPLLYRKDHGVSRGMDSYGNAVVPQIAQWIGECLLGVST